MASSEIEQFGCRVMSGEARGLGPALLRAVTAAVEPAYAGVVTARNMLFDRGVGVRRLPRPVISVGNVTAGGTGKTPVVRWICQHLRARGHRPAVPMRGYKSAASAGVSDEQVLLDRSLNRDRSLTPIVVHAQPDRLAGGQAVLARHPEVDVFVLDDGFQHRRLHRDFDLVLVDAARPFGFGHVHPRGLLREPLSGLRRADAILITRSDAAEEVRLLYIDGTIRNYAPQVPIYCSSHAHIGLRSAECPPDAPPDQPMEALVDKRCYVMCGIGNPQSFEQQVGCHAGEVIGHRWLGDHHAYTAADLADVQEEAEALAADVIVTTEKDWVKLEPLAQAQPCDVPVWRAELEIRIDSADEARILAQILGAISRNPVDKRT